MVHVELGEVVWGYFEGGGAAAVVVVVVKESSIVVVVAVDNIYRPFVLLNDKFWGDIFLFVVLSTCPLLSGGCLVMMCLSSMLYYESFFGENRIFRSSPPLSRCLLACCRLLLFLLF